MAYKPKPAGPRNLREMFHYLWRELNDVGTAIGEGGGGTDPDFAGPGTRGYVPDPITARGFVLSDSGAWVSGGGGSGDKNVDGGSASSVYTAPQVVDGGGA